MLNQADTIYALSSAPGKAGVAVVRVSGVAALAVLAALMGKAVVPRVATLAVLRHGGVALDKALVLSFPAPHSFTGEDVAELHLHGGRAIIAAVSAALADLGCRMAEPGEFTRRAFLNGKLDLAEAEGLADLLAAQTEAQRRQALAQMGGALSSLYEGWRGRLLRILAYCEADIDFVEEDLPAHILETRLAAMQELAAEIAAHLDDNHRGERLREGFYIAILGAPNAGKSSLLNALAGREAAIVSARAGTTRDVVEVHLDIGGYAVILADTAGLRETEDVVEAEGIRRALARAGQADLKLVLFDASQSQPDKQSQGLIDDKTLVVVNKCDRGDNGFAGAARISARTGAGIAGLLAAIRARIEAVMAQNPTPPLTRERHREALTHCLAALTRASHADNPLPELIAEDLRHATHHLARITGRVDVEDVLEVIFRDFCIGK